MNFTKLHASGNDFVAFRWEQIASLDDMESFCRCICRRHTGIGADGMISPKPSENSAFEFFYMNYMGKLVDFCGHAGRALPYFAKREGLVSGNRITYETSIGRKTASILEEKDNKALVGLDMGGFEISGSFVDVGVRHYVERVESVDDMDIESHAKDFFKKHTNVHYNIFSEIGPGRIKVRTWEYGYEYEPLSCATGCISSAIIYAKDKGLSHVEIVPLSGESLFVEISSSGIFFYGWVVAVFEGNILARCETSS